MAYRDPEQPPRPDVEAIAVGELAARAARLRRAILVPSVVLGVVGGLVGYVVIREVQFTFF